MSKSFIWLWGGQLISLLGSSLTGFGISLWAYEKTQSPYVLSLALLAKIGPSIYLSFFAGPIVDRTHPRTTLMLTNLGLLAITFVLFITSTYDILNIALLLTLLFFSGVIESFQSLTFQITVADFAKPEFYTKSQGVVSLVENSPMVLAPVLGAVFYQALGLRGILLLDVISFAAVLFIISWISFPKLKLKKTANFDLSGSFKIWRNPLLSRLMMFFMASNFMNGLLGGLVSAFVLAGTSGSEESLAFVQSAMAIGTVIGSIYVMAKGLPGNLTMWICLGTAAAAIFGRVGVALTSVVSIWALGLAIRSFLIPLIGAANQTLWLKEVPRAEMGSVFGARRVFAQGLYPVAVYVGGLLSKTVFQDQLFTMFLIIGVIEAGLGAVGCYLMSVKKTQTAPIKLFKFM